MASTVTIPHAGSLDKSFFWEVWPGRAAFHCLIGTLLITRQLRSDLIHFYATFWPGLSPLSMSAAAIQ